MDRDEAQAYLSSLLNKNLRISSSDGRLFRGAFKCTDHDRNVVLANTFEYRQQPPTSLAQQALTEGPEGSVALDMTSRYLGLVVIPGRHIVKMELDEFTSQLKMLSQLKMRGEVI